MFGVSSPISHMLWILIYYVTLFHFLYPCSNFGDWIKFFPIGRLWQKTHIDVCCYVFMYVQGLGKINYLLQSGYIVGTYIISD